MTDPVVPRNPAMAVAASAVHGPPPRIAFSIDGNAR